MTLRVAILAACLALSQAKVLDLTCTQVRIFVDGHNTRRLQLATGKVNGQPPASEMKYMVWDEELAQKAAKWAAQNKFQHNPDKDIASRRFKTGENLYVYGTSAKNHNFNPDTAMESWFNEHKDFKFHPLQSSDFSGQKPAIGHYTQMAWSDSTYVGCAISQYKENGMNSFLVVCNYGPSGNYIGATPYKSGPPGKRLTCGNSSCHKPYGIKCPGRK